MMIVLKHDQATSQVLNQALDLSEGRGEVHCHSNRGQEYW